MSQEKCWDKEYKKNVLVTLSPEPQKDALRFLKFLERSEKLDFAKVKALDLGSGTGRNAIWLARERASVTAYEISDTALCIAKKRSAESNISVNFVKHDIGKTFPAQDREFDIIVDVLSVNSLSRDERGLYFNEIRRVIKPNGYFFLKTLRWEGDKNAKTLAKINPGPEEGSYVMKETGLTEKTFTEKELREALAGFTIIKMASKVNYATVLGKTYKRNYWIVYAKMPS